MNILLTGGNGFVGRHIVARLVADGHSVLAPVRTDTAPSIEGVRWLTGASFDALDWLTEAPEAVDVVIHAAAHAHQTRKTDERDRQKFREVNVELSGRLFECAAAAGVRQFVFISSIGAVRGPSDQVISDDSEPQPADAYGRSKRDAELLLASLARETATALTVVRPCLVYGPGNPGNMERLSRLIDTGVPLPLAGIRSRRSYVYVENLIDAIGKLLLDERAFDRSFIVCDDEAPSLPEVIRAIGEAKGVRVRLFTVPHFLLRLAGWSGDLVNRLTGRDVGIDSYSVEKLSGSLQCDAVGICSALDWSPPYSFEAGISCTFRE